MNKDIKTSRELKKELRTSRENRFSAFLIGSIIAILFVLGVDEFITNGKLLLNSNLFILIVTYLILLLIALIAYSIYNKYVKDKEDKRYY